MKRPLFKYAGSKWRLVPHYPYPRHDVIIEPFAGSACYATRYHEREVILIEKDPDIAALWKYLISADSNEIGSLPTSTLKRGQDIRLLPASHGRAHATISRGAALLIRQWQRVGMSNCWTVSDWNGMAGQWCSAVRDNIARSVESIRHWKVIQNDCRNVAFDSRKATWFIDPPYFGLPLYGSESIDFAGLADWCKGRPGQVIVCEQASADWLPFVPFRSITKAARGKGKSIEGVWTNDAEALQSLLRKADCLP
jgi:site-specific DNA-adenine methylase